MMKQALAFFLSLILLFTSLSAVAAQEGSPPAGLVGQGKLQQLQERLRIQREEVKQEQQEKKAAIQARLSEAKQKRIRRFFNRLVQRFEAAIERLEKLIDRIESRLAQIAAENEGLDTAAIKDALEEARKNLVAAQEGINQAQSALEEVLNSQEPKEAFAPIRGLIKEVKDELIEVHRILVHLIGDIRGLRITTTK